MPDPKLKRTSAYGSVPDPFPNPLKLGKGRQRQTKKKQHSHLGTFAHLALWSSDIMLWITEVTVVKACHMCMHNLLQGFLCLA